MVETAGGIVALGVEMVKKRMEACTETDLGLESWWSFSVNALLFFYVSEFLCTGEPRKSGKGDMPEVLSLSTNAGCHRGGGRTGK